MRPVNLLLISGALMVPVADDLNLETEASVV
jgi:hypothetical protein